MIQVNARVLASTTKKAKESGKEYNLVTLRVDGEVFKMFSPVSLASQLDQDILLDCGLTPNREGFASLSIVGLSEKKK